MAAPMESTTKVDGKANLNHVINGIDSPAASAFWLAITPATLPNTVRLPHNVTLQASSSQLCDCIGPERDSRWGLTSRTVGILVKTKDNTITSAQNPPTDTNGRGDAT